MDHVFANYEQDFNDVFSSVQGRIRSIPTLMGAAKQDAVRAAEGELQDAEEILRSMSFSARNVPPANARPLMQKLKDYEADVAQAKKELRGVQTRISESVDRDSLFGGGGGGAVLDSGLGQNQREAMLNDTARLSRGGDTLREALIVAEQTVQIGDETMQNLARDREKMQRSMYTLDEVNDKLTVAGRYIKVMARRAMTNKFIMAVITLVMVGLIILICWIKFGSSSSDSSDSSSSSTTGTTTGTTSEDSYESSTTGSLSLL